MRFKLTKKKTRTSSTLEVEAELSPSLISAVCALLRLFFSQ